MTYRKYTPTSRVLHWLAVLLIACQFLSGMLAAALSRDHSAINDLNQFHSIGGMLILLLAVLRLYQRYKHPAPPPPSGMSLLAVHGVKAAHWLLYALMLSIPLIGLLAGGEENWRSVHRAGAYGFLILIGLHVTAVLWHHVMHKDRLLERMW
jgi:cytochrome b561